MELGENDKKPHSGKLGASSSRREEQRAAALRANLQRRKAQARGRADLLRPKAETGSEDASD